MRRARQLHWVLGHLRDIESDMSAIHGIDNIWTMNGPRFFSFAYRLPAYQGAMRALAERQAMQQEKRTGGREVINVGTGELSKIENLGGRDGTPWVSLEKATDS